MSAWTAVHRMAKPPERLVRLVLESHDGTALVPIPERSTSPRVTFICRGQSEALDPDRPIREADMLSRSCDASDQQRKYGAQNIACRLSTAPTAATVSRRRAVSAMKLISSNPTDRRA